MALLLSVLFWTASAFAQNPSLSLDSGSVAAGGSISLNLSLTDGGGRAPAAIQWMMAYPPWDMTSFGITAGPALSSAGKTLHCMPGTGWITCVVSGLNSNQIGSGVVGVVTLTITPSPGNSSDTIAILGVTGAYSDATLANITAAGSTISIVHPAPVITSPTTASATVGSAFSYQIAATNTPTSFGATGLPAGLSMNSSTGLISGTPTAAGTVTVTLSATNLAGTGSALLTLTVAPQPSNRFP